MADYRVVVTDLLIDDEEHRALGSERAVLEPLGAELVIAESTDPNAIVAAGENAIGMLVTYARIDREIMSRLPELRVIVKLGIGYDNIDVEAAAELGILTANVPDYGDEEVALHALGLLLTGIRAIDRSALAARGGEWITDLPKLRIRRLSGMTVGTLGMGRIARKFHEYLAPLTDNRLYFDPFVDAFDGVERVSTIEELFSRCDVVSLHLPLGASTKGIVAEAALACARPGLYLINTSRAGLVDADAIAAAVASGQVHYFGSDVYWTEPFDAHTDFTSDFIANAGVTLTPHTAWYSAESDRDLRRKAAEEVGRVIDGGAPKNRVGPPLPAEVAR